MDTQKHNYSHQTGFTLIEVLIAAMLIALGLLGHLSMQAASIDMNRTGVHHTKASQLANEMAERMRNNPSGITNGEYDLAQPISTANVNFATFQKNYCVNNTCSATANNRTQFDLDQWAVDLRSLSDGATGNISLIQNGDPALPVYEIEITWPTTGKQLKTSNLNNGRQTVKLRIGFST